jgi:hypothetical protein
MPNTPPYTLSNPMAGHTPTLSEVNRKPIPKTGKPPKIAGGTLLSCECGWKWYTQVDKVDGSYALANTAYSGHTLAVQDGTAKPNK